MKNRQSLAFRNIIILILSILPFFCGIGLSVYQSSDTEYFSSAINVAGSQRMRTMLISNYVQSYSKAIEDQKIKEITSYKELLVKELELYEGYYYGLIYGYDTLGLKENEFLEIRKELLSFEVDILEYVELTERVINNPNDDDSLDYITSHALAIKDRFDKVTGMFQAKNDIYISSQRNIDIIMISFGALITIIGIVLSLKIREKEYHANYDFLTGLKNRHSLYEDIQDLIIERCSICFIDLNKFKLVNDTFGHEIGDEILIEVSKRLRSIFGATHLYRYGGDEYIAIVEDVADTPAEENVSGMTTCVWRMLTKPVVDSYNRDHYISLSMGVVLSDVKLDDWNALINLSDDLMYDSKNISSNLIVCKTREALEKRINLKNVIDDIFAKGTIKLKYQPVHYLSDETIYMYSVTSSLENDGKQLNADEFIPMLKRRGYLREVDMASLIEIEKRYLEDRIEAGNNSGYIRYSINFSEDTFRYIETSGLLDIIENLKMPKDALVIKVQEALLDDVSIQDKLTVLKSMGVIIAVNNIVLDVSLQDMDRYRNIDILKIGYNLTQALMEKHQTKRIMVEFIQMFSQIGKSIIIEGAERTVLEDLVEDYGVTQSDKSILYSHKLID